MMRSAIAVTFALLSLMASAQDRVLVPVAYNGPGAFGSQWTTVVGAYNPSPAPWRAPGIAFIRYDDCVIPEGCPTDVLTGAGQVVRAGSSQFDAPGGFFIHLDELAEPYLYARFGSSPGSEIGADLPLPTDLDFKDFTQSIPYVATGGGPVRTHLRIYELTGRKTVIVHVQVRPIFLRGAKPVELQVVVRPQQPPGTDPVLLPSFAVVSLTDLIGDQFHVADIQFHSGMSSEPYTTTKLWAFVTVTHTETQQVGVFTPVLPTSLR